MVTGVWHLRDFDCYVIGHGGCHVWSRNCLPVRTQEITLCFWLGPCCLPRFPWGFFSYLTFIIVCRGLFLKYFLWLFSHVVVSSNFLILSMTNHTSFTSINLLEKNNSMSICQSINIVLLMIYIPAIGVCLYPVNNLYSV